MWIEVYYCHPTNLSSKGWATGSSRFSSYDAMGEWINNNMIHGPVLITAIVDLQAYRKANAISA